VCSKPNKERNHRAVIEQEKLNKQVDTELLKAIAEAIESISGISSGHGQQ
jgi:hypothetical protein